MHFRLVPHLQNHGIVISMQLCTHNLKYDKYHSMLFWKDFENEFGNLALVVVNLVSLEFEKR